MEARKAGRLFHRIIAKIFEKNKDYVQKASHVKIQNLVASVDVKFPVRLEGLAYEHDDYSSVSYLAFVLISFVYQYILYFDTASLSN